MQGGPNGGSVENESEVEHNLLFEVRGSGPSEMYAIQVEAVSGKLSLWAVSCELKTEIENLR